MMRILSPLFSAGLLFTFLATGCSSGTTSSGSGTTTPPLTAPALGLSASSLSFASTTVGQTSATQSVTLTNSGGTALTLSSIVLSDTKDYALTTTCAATLAASASCALSLSFLPQSAASLPATVTITDNATGSPQTLALAGTGAAAAVSQAMLSATTVTFPATAAGSSAAPVTVTLTNAGTATMTLTSILLTGANATSFSQSNTCGTTLAATASCTITLGFSPTGAGGDAAYIAITDNSGGIAGSVQDVVLAGTATAAPSAAQAVLTPAAITFSTASVGAAAPTQVVTLSNPGTSALTGIAVSIGGGTAATAFSETSTCGTTLAAGSTCTITVAFTPMTTGTFAATLSVADTATGSPQTVALTGVGAAPQATLSAPGITFPATTVDTTTAPYSVTLTNTGAATLTISNIALGGSTGSAFPFVKTTTCGATLAAAAACTISATFSPSAGSSYTGTITITDNATNVQTGNAAGTQTIALAGTGSTSAITRTLYTFPESDLSVTPLYTLINNAQKTIDMTMYELVDTTFSADLVAACNRGVKVRVILDQNLEKSSNTAAYNQLNAVTNCSAAWANPAFQATHQKTFIVDGTTTAIMSLNLTSRYYSTTRDFALVENDPIDIAAIQATFNTDYGSTTDYTYQPGPGDDLIWSPTTAQPDLLGIINSATTTLLVENEEMSAANIVSALEAACQRGVSVHIAMTDTGSYHANFSALEAAGCGVHTYVDNATTLYIHAKAMVADYGLATQNIYMGSINFSIASMTENRELGLYIADPASAQALYTTINSDYAGAPPF